ncbi:MAG: Exodeoxyribonuclease 7 large subunit [Gemmatimonadetes bacterium]|jgi:exodeoxyribonuclease VII large subunit|nr:Exodeoxyribonuclease 7 large subunit [Gemmatimonadota bacterium]
MSRRRTPPGASVPPALPSLFDAAEAVAEAVAEVVAEVATDALAVAESVGQAAARPSSTASRVARSAGSRTRAPARTAPPASLALSVDVSVELEPADPAGAYPGGSVRSAIPVSMLTQTAKDVVEGAFPPVWVRGEISDFKAHRNGHWYFCLRDESSQLRCVVWSRDQRAMPATPDDGMQVAALGQLGVYAARGEMQFTIRRIEAEGDGLWRKALEQARRRLAADGLLAPERKRPLPRFPRRIAMITSASGAALRDVIAVLRRRAPGVELFVVHAAVQGEQAPLELCAALDQVARWGGAELVIIGRGGGSREDLWAFNDERVARALAACPVPTISAVGHEVDISLCDLVADVRAPTPSAAAESAVPSQQEIGMLLADARRRLEGAIEVRVLDARASAGRLAQALAASTGARLAERQATVGALAGRLHALSPLATLSRGYAVPRDDAGRTLGSVRAFRAEMPFVLRLADGEVDASVLGTRPHPGGEA